MARTQVDGKRFLRGGERMHPRGVTYGTFAPREDGACFPDRDVVKRDFAAVSEAGFNLVRTYTPPPDDVLDLAADCGLTLLTDLFYLDWRYLLGASGRQTSRVARKAREVVRREARRLRDSEVIFAVSLGNEIPADVVRWVGTRRVVDLIGDLAEVVRSEDPQQLVTYANYPTSEYLSLPSLDFLTFNVFLEERKDLRRYLMRLHHIAGDRPLMLGETGLESGNTPDGECRQAEAIDWMLATALERGVAGTCIFSWTDEWTVGGVAVDEWHFGLTRADRSPRPALDVAASWNTKTVADLDWPWPTMSVVVCAHNAEATLDECLRHTCSLDYPGLEVIVVDDGSSDGTAEIAKRHPRARYVPIAHGGLSVARNVGLQESRGEVVAYLDADAYPPPEWPYYLALGFDSQMVGGVGGPNVPPRGDPPGAHRVAHAPGGPVHVLLSDDRAEHIPGCNMAFWREKVLEGVGGFDPIYDAAGDDVDLCWRVLDRGWEIAFHPAALVWHHRRPGLRPYLRQQRGYGRAEALVEARHPDRFTAAGTARWRGRIYSLLPALARQRVYRGVYGSAAYQSVYRDGGHLLDLAHQLGVPAAVVLIATVVAAWLHPLLALPAAAALAFITGLGLIDIVRTRTPSYLETSGWRFRVGVATLHLLQPLFRLWGRARHTPRARRSLGFDDPLPGPPQAAAHGVLVVPADRPRTEVAAAAVSALRRSGRRVQPATGWEDHDGRIAASILVAGDLVTSGHPIGCVQLRVRLRPHWSRLSLLAAATAVLAVSGLWQVAFGSVLLAGVDMLRGVVRAGPGARRAIAAACHRR